MNTKDSNSFVLYKNWAVLLVNLPTEQAGLLIKAICAKEIGEDIDIDDPTVSAMFAMIEPKLEEDAQSYSDKKSRRQSAASKRWDKDQEENPSDADTEECNAVQTDAMHQNADANGCNALQCIKDEMQTDAMHSNADAEGCNAMQMHPDTVTDTDTVTETENEHPSGAKREKGARGARPVSAERHRYGTYKHVLLTDKQLEVLNSRHSPESVRAAIQAVDDYCEQHGKTYKNYALTIEKWGFRAAKENARSGTTAGFDIDAYLASVAEGGMG